jgi:hypothetical protein
MTKAKETDPQIVKETLKFDITYGFSNNEADTILDMIKKLYTILDTVRTSNPDLDNAYIRIDTDIEDGYYAGDMSPRASMTVIWDRIETPDEIEARITKNKARSKSDRDRRAKNKADEIEQFKQMAKKLKVDLGDQI